MGLSIDRTIFSEDELVRARVRLLAAGMPFSKMQAELSTALDKIDGIAARHVGWIIPIDGG